MSVLTNKSTTDRTAAGTPERLDIAACARLSIQALGSLRLTVCLLSLGLVLVLIATLQQTRRDIYEVKTEHFSSPLVHVEFRELLPPAWFPDYQNIGGGFLMPSGVAVLIALLVNLFFAHLLRFRIQATGLRLAAGVAVMALGAIITALVILNGNSHGFQDEPIISWQSMWTLIQVGMGVALAVTVYGIAALGPTQRMQRIMLIVLAAVLGPVLAYTIYKGEEAFIGDDAMRVVWRLMQGSVAAIVMYFGAMMVFRRKAGIVIIHTGLLMLMVGELYTTYSAVEQRMSLIEGQSASFAVNIDSVEMAIIRDNQDGTEDVITIPAERLTRGDVIDDARLPFKIQLVDYFPNSAISQIAPGEQVIPAQGMGGVVKAVPIPVGTGTDTEQLPDTASAYVQLTDNSSGADLGTYLISQQMYQNQNFDLDTVSIDGEPTYQIGLRFKHYYKPYTVLLEDTNRDNYVGTEIAQTYSSTFQLIDKTHEINERKSVSMNNPLRYNNETFYQSGHGFTGDGKEYSVFQIVQNTGWMIPYVSCAFVGIGLLVHFLSAFLRFTARILPVAGYQRYDRLSWVIVLGVMAVFGFWTLSQMRIKQIDYEGMRLDKFGQIPVVYGGRVQPIDSLARTSLRQLRKREIAVDKNDDKQPAVRWFADVMFGDENFKKFKVIRVEDPEVMSALDLFRRKSHLYSLEEIEMRRDQLQKYLGAANDVRRRNEAQLTVFQKKIIELSDLIDMIYSIRYSMGDPSRFDVEDPFETISWLSTVAGSKRVPLAVPNEDASKWSALSPNLAGPWLAALAKQRGAGTPEELAQSLVEEYLADELREAIFKQQLTERFVEDVGMDLSQFTPQQLDELVSRMIEDPPPEVQNVLQRIRERIRPMVDSILQVQISRVAVNTAARMRQIVPGDINRYFGGDSQSTSPALWLQKLEEAYRANDAQAFNAAVVGHLESVGTSTQTDIDSSKVVWELFHNSFSPFYVATTLYICSLLIGLLSWLCIAGSFTEIATVARRASFWLIVLALIVHTIGLVTRIYISGRPPVTNLYGSAIFIGWAGAIFGLFIERLTRMGLGTILGSIGGIITLLVAFSLAVDGDTFSVLVAVLDTQFWLSTHVVCITLGYAATFAAGTLGIAYIIGSVLTPSLTPELKTQLSKLIYGVTCFALLLSFVGTVLGGLWADDSWGRFWGWDPKENGALMIVLANAILLHARWAGLVRQRGIAMLAVFGNIVTIWSWFAVNELGIGLHSYGLTEGRMMWVGITWLFHLAVIGLACTPISWWISNRTSPAAK